MTLYHAINLAPLASDSVINPAVRFPQTVRGTLAILFCVSLAAAMDAFFFIVRAAMQLARQVLPGRADPARRFLETPALPLAAVSVLPPAQV